MAVILKPDKSFEIFGVQAYEYLLTKHNPNKIAMPTIGMDYQGVTIHNTEWIVTARGTTPAEQYTRATYNGNMGDVRVHYYCDNVCIWQNLPLTLGGWHAADGAGFGNRKTVAIECIMSPAYNDKDKASEDNCARLAAYLLHAKGYGTERLYTHVHHMNVRYGVKGSLDYLNTYKGNYKYCPVFILPHWAQFKAKVQKYLDELNDKETPAPTPTPAPVPTPAPQGQIYRIRKDWKDPRSQIGAYRNLNSAKKICAENPGYNVYDEKGAVVYSNAPKQLAAGVRVTLHNASYYVAAASKTPVRVHMRGTFYIWSPTVLNGRIRITTRPDWAGKSGRVTAWVPVADMTVD